MYYHSPQFQNIADQAAAYARPLILQTIRDLAADFVQQFPCYTGVHCSTGQIVKHYGTASFKTRSQANQHPFLDFLRDVTQKDLIGFCPDITIQPAVLVDGVPIEEAIQNAANIWVNSFVPD